MAPDGAWGVVTTPAVAEGGSAPAVVVGLDCMTGLQTTRILDQRGVPVFTLAARPDHPCCRTRRPRRKLTAPLEGAGLVAALLRLGPELPTRAVLLPCTDRSVLTISRHRAELTPWYHVVLPAPDVVETLADKLRFHAYAEAAGLPVPATFVLRSRADAEAAARQLSFPCLLKPPSKTVRWEAETKAKVFKVPDGAALLSLYDRCQDWSELLVAQQWVAGSDEDLYSCNAYFDAQSRPLVSFVARKLRQWPPETGTSCLGEECENDEVRDVAVRLFQGIGFHGLAYLEMKRDRRNGQLYIIEPNIGRPTGRSAIAEGGGVALLYTMYCDVLGLPLPAERVQHYRGVKWLDLRRDLQSAAHYWRGGTLTPREILQSWRGHKVHALWDPADPKPFVADLAHAAELALRAAVQRARPKEGLGVG